MRGSSGWTSRGSGARCGAALLAAVALAGAAQAGADEVEHVPGLGPAVQEGAFWRVLLGDGTSVLTHGPDDPESHMVFGTYVPDGTPASVVCTPSTQRRFEIVYAYARDDVNRFKSVGPMLAEAVYAGSEFIHHEAVGAGGQGARLPVECDQHGNMVVHREKLPTTMAGDHFGTIMTDLRARGYDSTTAKYIVYYDDCLYFSASMPCWGGGFGTLRRDDRPTADNANNGGPSYAVDVAGPGYRADGKFSSDPNTDTPHWYTLLHEAGHTMGAVQNSAPHSTGAGHCWDGYDVMCYPDGGPTGKAWAPLCPATRFDCMGDDYFNPRPLAGTYLASHWNIGAAANAFVNHGPR